MHEERLARAKCRALDERVIGGKRGHEEARALGEVEAAREPHELRRREHDLLGIAALTLTGDDAVAHAPARDVGSNLGNDARSLDAGNERKRRLVLVSAENGERVGKVDAGGEEADACRARQQRQLRHRFEPERLGWTEGAAEDGAGHPQVSRRMVIWRARAK